MNASEAAEKLRQEISQKAIEADNLEKLQAAYPDIERYVGRWNKVVYCSKSVNSVVTDYDYRHNCGCCGDSPLEIWPFIETPYGKVYSNPPRFIVGERNSYRGGDDACPDWDSGMRKACIPESMIVRISPLLHHGDHDEETDDE